MSHTRSYYANSITDIPEYPQLRDRIKCDVCIIGAGFSGLSSALHLCEAGYDVVVLEGCKVGFGATGRNGGQVVNSYSRDVDVIEKRYDSTTANTLCSMIFEGGDIIRDIIKRYDVDCDYKVGGVFAALNQKQLKGLQQHKRDWERFGNSQLELLDANELSRALGTTQYVGGLLDKRGGHIHPLKLALGEAKAIESLGGRIFEQSKVISMEKRHSPVVKTELGEVQARYVVIAGNAYLGQLAPKISNKAIPCGTQVIATEPLSASLLETILPSDYCVEDCNYLLDYFRLTADKRLLFGGGVVYGARDPQNIEALVRPKMEKVFPQLQGIKVDYTWTGNFLLTYSRMPQFGVHEDNFYYLQGYSGHGVTCSHLAGKLLTESLSGHSNRFNAFASLKHYAFPGGRHLQIPLTALGAAYYNIRDKLAV
ncbi:FAD-binding oxidoreductase [Vibrio sp. S4M6]|uniref:NAD(P)/FAD-dependent oxidoreductase n=1 Tax=Vibrio sinus TaxID=2946865 RepID=UPI00202A6CFE|nr:FAD-binding oxidoreductase [Vibrio sinus]MCL9781286.1 FAD-binding oxidoreductase [Vibrio sinus]